MILLRYTGYDTENHENDFLKALETHPEIELIPPINMPAHRENRLSGLCRALDKVDAINC